MSKRGNQSGYQPSVLRVTGGKIKGYHDFKIKGPEGTPVNVMHESGNRDPFALQCILPSAEQIPEALLDIELTSKSAKKSYTLRDVAGRQIGRMQYFLNRELKELMDCGKVNGIKGVITGQPTVTKRPPVGQKWRQNFQQGGGAYIPCQWIIRCADGTVEEVKEKIEKVISELGDEGVDMDVEVNLVFFVILLKVVFGKLATKYNNDQMMKTRKGLKSVAALLPLLGVTWLLGLFIEFHEVLAYIFILLTSTQGIVFCIFHCILDEQVQRTISRKFNRTILHKNVFPGQRQNEHTITRPAEIEMVKRRKPNETMDTVQ